MDKTTEQKVVDALKEDPDFQNALKKYEYADEQSQKFSMDMADKIVEMLHLQDTNQTIEEARYNLLIAKLSAAKLLATLSSFSYEEKDFVDAIDNARKCVQEELVPMLLQSEPCGECENCKNGRPDECIRPHIRHSHSESRFLPILAESLIEYDAWNEILYNSIPQDKRDVDILKDINEDFENSKIIPKKGRPAKSKEE